jgi:hypothetical protein
MKRILLVGLLALAHGSSGFTAVAANGDAKPDARSAKSFSSFTKTSTNGVRLT